MSYILGSSNLFSPCWLGYVYTNAETETEWEQHVYTWLECVYIAFWYFHIFSIQIDAFGLRGPWAAGIGVPRRPHHPHRRRWCHDTNNWHKNIQKQDPEILEDVIFHEKVSHKSVYTHQIEKNTTWHFMNFAGVVQLPFKLHVSTTSP